MNVLELAREQVLDAGQGLGQDAVLVEAHQQPAGALDEHEIAVARECVHGGRHRLRREPRQPCPPCGGRRRQRLGEARQLVQVVGAWPAVPDLASRCNLEDLPAYAGAPLLGCLPAGAGALGREAFLAMARESLNPTGVPA